MTPQQPFVLIMVIKLSISFVFVMSNFIGVSYAFSNSETTSD